MIENIQKSGWNQYAPASGLQVTHVNYNATRWNNNSVNNYAAQGMTIIPADNSLKTIYSGGYYFTDESDQVGDLYPYNGNNQLTSTSTPAATLYNSSTNLNKPITNITKNSNNTVSFTYMGSQAPATPSPYIYVLTNTLTAGKEYLIVNANSVGSRYAMGHSNTTVASDAVTVKSDPTVAEAPYIESTDVDATSVWTAGSSGSLWTFKNGNYFVTLTDRNALTFTTSSTRNWTKGTNQLYNINRNNNYYLRYNNNNFSVSTTSANIYIYEKREVTLTGVPTIVSAEPTSTTAEITWTPGENNEDWNLRYREYVEGASSGQSTLWDLSLANYQTQIADFSVYDADGDGDVWGLVYSNEEQTDVCFASWSYDPDTQSDLTPDNWLFTPEVELGGTLKFKSALRLTGWPDKLGVYVLPTGDDSYYKLGDIVPDAVFPSFGEYEFDLSDFEGMGQIAFRHYESDGNVAILLDDIEVITAAVSGGQWIYVDSENSPYTITGLTPETAYEVQVQGVGDGGATSAWTASTLFTTLSLEEAVEATLAEIEGGGTVGITYTISDELVAVHADTDGEYGMLWCKDQGNASINPSSILVGQIDFMRDEALTGDTGQGNCDWDQSNWVVLKFPAAASANGIADLLNDAVGKKIKVGTVTGRYIDKSNYTIEVQPVDGAYVLTYNGTLDYTPNVYCVANFVESNLNIGGNTGAVGAHGVHYFFMNPKIQEVCEITYAMWDGEKFVTPDNTEIKGALNVDWSHNSDVGVPSLREGQTYRFKAIVTHPATRLNGLKGGGTPSDNFVVSPTNLTGEGNIVTAINGVYTESYREVVGVEYVNSLGVVSKTPFQGVNIVVTRYSDGSATSVKKVFK